MNSNYIKTSILCWLRFAKQVSVIATEVGVYNSDVLYSHKDKLFEIEVKTSLADFKEDFKKPKHEDYKKTSNSWAPNFFIFAVPPELVAKTLPLIENGPYGMISISPAFNENNVLVAWEKRVTVIKRPKALHSRNCNDLVKQKIVHRLASELCGMRQKAYGRE